VYGVAGGTHGGKVTCTTQSSLYVGGTAEAEENFGAALSVVDIDGSGPDSLLAGASHEAVDTAVRAGAYRELESGPRGRLLRVGLQPELRRGARHGRGGRPVRGRR
jgi:hypothetical protein